MNAKTQAIVDASHEGLGAVLVQATMSSSGKMVTSDAKIILLNYTTCSRPQNIADARLIQKLKKHIKLYRVGRIFYYVGHRRGNHTSRNELEKESGSFNE